MKRQSGRHWLLKVSANNRDWEEGRMMNGLRTMPSSHSVTKKKKRSRNKTKRDGGRRRRRREKKRTIYREAGGRPERRGTKFTVGAGLWEEPGLSPHPPCILSRPPLLSEDARNPAEVFPGFMLQGAAEGGFEPPEHTHMHRHTNTHRHTANVWGTHTPWVPGGGRLVLLDVLRAVISLLPPAHCDGHQDWLSKCFSFFAFLLHK